MEKNIQIIDALKIFFTPKRYVNSLCEHYGEPEGVIRHLRDLAGKYPVFKSVVLLFIKIEEQQCAQNEIDHQLGIDFASEEKASGNKCVDCSWGNGMGGCTIPECCYQIK